jgi:hypothetical protein
MDATSTPLRANPIEGAKFDEVVKVIRAVTPAKAGVQKYLNPAWAGLDSPIKSGNDQKQGFQTFYGPVKIDIDTMVENL